jgi:hypothetical protein
MRYCLSLLLTLPGHPAGRGQRQRTHGRQFLDSWHCCSSSVLRLRPLQTAARCGCVHTRRAVVRQPVPRNSLTRRWPTSGTRTRQRLLYARLCRPRPGCVRVSRWLHTASTSDQEAVPCSFPLSAFRFRRLMWSCLIVSPAPGSLAPGSRPWPVEVPALDSGELCWNRLDGNFLL